MSLWRKGLNANRCFLACFFEFSRNIIIISDHWSDILLPVRRERPIFPKGHLTFGKRFRFTPSSCAHKNGFINNDCSGTGAVRLGPAGSGSARLLPCRSNPPVNYLALQRQRPLSHLSAVAPGQRPGVGPDPGRRRYTRDL